MTQEEIQALIDASISAIPAPDNSAIETQITNIMTQLAEIQRLNFDLMGRLEGQAANLDTEQEETEVREDAATPTLSELLEGVI